MEKLLLKLCELKPGNNNTLAMAVILITCTAGVTIEAVLS